jgi:uncharacterized protein
MSSALVLKTRDYVKQALSEAEGGHDWEHIRRVWQTGKLLLEQTPEADAEVVELAALLHDIADSKFHGGDEEIGPRTAAHWLSSQSFDSSRAEHVVQIVRHMGFKGGAVSAFTSLEMDLVQDADRLDALGAIGIARCFSFGGYKGNPIYLPDFKPNPGMSKEEYKKSNSPSLNHFYEKLLLLKDRMNTPAGREEAERRDAFLRQFLDEFFREMGERPEGFE